VYRTISARTCPATFHGAPRLSSSNFLWLERAQSLSVAISDRFVLEQEFRPALATTSCVSKMCDVDQLVKNQDDQQYTKVSLHRDQILRFYLHLEQFMSELEMH
jgi:hypothetical protein